MIQVENLQFTYPGHSEPTIKNIDFAIQTGEIVGFLGPSGAGKSTTQKILIGLLKDYQGKIFIFGKNLRYWKSDYYEKIGVSFERPNHYLRLTALENLQYFASLYNHECENPMELLEQVNLGNDAGTLVGNYSKGMKVRLNFIRALLHKPELIFFDEPTTGLDPVNAQRIKEIILEKKHQGKTIFLTTHNMTVADELCDRVAFLVDGEIRLIDNPRNLKLKYGKHTVKVEYQLDGRVNVEEFEMAGLGENKDFWRVLKESDVQTIHSQETTLEDIFIQETGRRLV